MRARLLVAAAACVGALLAAMPAGALPAGPPPTSDPPPSSSTTTTTTTAPTTTTTTPASTTATPAPPPDVAAAQGSLTGQVLSGATALEDYTVTLFVAGGPGQTPVALGIGVTDAGGAFAFDPASPVPPNGVAYLVAESPAEALLPTGARTLASVVGVGSLPGTVVVNELTTVATAYALAQFIGAGTEIAGPSPGLQNAAGMAWNLADPVSGGVGAVLATSPNGGETSAINTFNSLANMVAACVNTALECDGYFTAATSPEGEKPATTFRALVNVARDPWNGVDALFAVSLLPPASYAPARVAPPPAWTIALRFNGDGVSLDGPGNIAIDHEGFLWVNNNYAFSPETFVGVCDSKELFQFTPTGQFVPGSPFTGGGLSGAGFGIDIDPFGDIWVGNYGFASPPPNCAEEDQPPHNSVSQFRPDGTPVSPDTTGFTQGGINWPQATVSDDQGNIWMANCADGSVTLYPEGDPRRAKNVSNLGLTEPFGIAHNKQGVAFVTGIGSSTVAMIGPNGTPLPGSPISGPFLDNPMGIAADSSHNLWIANSGLVDLPCPDIQGITPSQGSVGLLGPDGTPLSPTPFQAGGVTIPWGIAVDGNDNVWVANFAGKRLSQFCGVKVTDCRPGTTTGDAISPDVTGYGFDGLVRNTGVAIDPSGNVWLTNNWKEIPFLPGNPGGYEIVAFVGMAGPVQPPAPRARPPAPTPALVPTVRFAG